MKCTLPWIALFVLSACAADPPTNGEALDERDIDEEYRLQFHFTPPANWMNDPNGLVHFRDEYHLFYQYYPGDTVWGPMHWGHAVSEDLVHWQDLPIALYPDEFGYIFSGSAVVDWDNTSGFGLDGEPPLVAIFTYHDPDRGAAGTNDHETQGVAYSTDRGRTWTKYRGNPVMPNLDKHRDFRDPNVIWHEPSRRWIMALSVSDHVQFWASPDLKTWEYLSAFGKEWGAHGGVWECPDLFPVVVDNGGAEKWVLILNLNPGGPQGGSGTQYFVGDFDGRTFTLDERFSDTLREQEAVWLDWGRDNYAGITWSDAPLPTTRRVFIGWMSNWDYAQQVPTSSWRSAMTVPRELRLVEHPQGYRLHSEPVAALDELRSERLVLAPSRVRGDYALGTGAAASQADVRLTFDLERTGAGEFGVLLSNDAGEEYRLTYRAGTREFVSDRRRAGNNDFSEQFADRVHVAPRLSESATLELRLLLDTASIEVFADGGGTVLTDIYFPSQPFNDIRVFAAGEGVEMTGGEIYLLDSIWR